MAKTPTYEASTPQELVARFKSGEIPGSYVVEGVGRGGTVTARSKTALPRDKKSFFEQEQRRQKAVTSERSDISKTAIASAKEKITSEIDARKIKTAEADTKKKAKDDLTKIAEKATSDKSDLANTPQMLAAMSQQW